MTKEIKGEEGLAEELVGVKEKNGGSSFKNYLLIALMALVAMMGINNYIDASASARNRAGVGFGGCGGCGGCASGGAVDGARNEELARIGLEFYVESSGDTEITGVQVEVQDFGCHQEIYIYKDGIRVMRIGYSSGQLYRMS